MPPTVALPFCILVPGLLAGCVGDAPEEVRCGLSVRPHAPSASERPAEVTEDWLAQRPLLADLLRRPNVAGGVGSAVECDRGAEEMAQLAALGGSTREFDSGSREAIVAYKGAAYVVSLGYPA